jgi:hypothetical protein
MQEVAVVTYYVLQSFCTVLLLGVIQTVKQNPRSFAIYNKRQTIVFFLVGPVHGQ